MLFSLFYLSPATCCLCWLLVVGVFLYLEVLLLSFMRGSASASSAPVPVGVSPVVSPVEDLGGVDLVDTGHFVREPGVLPVGDLSRSVLGADRKSVV